jgi:hypothetical protein
MQATRCRVIDDARTEEVASSRSFSWREKQWLETRSAASLTAELGALLVELAFEGMFRALPRLREIGVSAFCEWMHIAMRKLALHGVVAVLFALVGLERSLATVGIVFQVIGSVTSHE